MSNKRVRVALIYGGRSGEHEVSVESARSVMDFVDRAKYEVVPIGISQEGVWRVADETSPLLEEREGAQRVVPSAHRAQPGLIPLTAAPAPALGLVDTIDVVFPLTHGTFGEDGCLQGLLELAAIPYVGSGVLGSAVGMDKIVMKTIFRAHGFPVTDFLPLARADWEQRPSRALDAIEEHIGFPCFVKPSNLGSSVGITKVQRRHQLPAALAAAAEFGARIMAERAIDGRELECGVLGNHEPEASVVGEVIPAREFYDYEAKYRDPRTQFVIPAHIPPETQSEVQELALGAFRAIGAAGMARVDFFLARGDGRVYLNEINTIPGFTSMSVYPRLWAASGLPYPRLIDRLIELALERHADESRNRTRYE